MAKAKVNYPRRPLREILDILSEECGEIVQAVGKSNRHGLDSRHPRTPLQDNRELLTRELGDLLAVLDVAINAGLIDVNALQQAKFAKLTALKQWTHTIPQKFIRHSGHVRITA